MNEHEAESGVEVVLDNRKIILAFVAFIAICGGFFVLGFMEGKRQGYQAGMQTVAEVGTVEGPQAPKSELPETEMVQNSEAPKKEAEEQPLNWYKNVNRREEAPETKPRVAADNPKRPDAAPAGKSPSKPKTEAGSLRAGSISYTVQVGAFVKQEEAETRGGELRSKGFDYRIEPPVSPSKFYFVKVGKFDSRAEAVAMQLRLKNSGFSCFIKTD
jgi:cell division protein FtsN